MQKRWDILNERLIGKKTFLYLTPAHLSFYRGLRPMLKKYARGKLIDLGAGKLILKPWVIGQVKSYQSVDLKKTHPDLDFIADIEDLKIFENNSFDTVLCIQVLEHTSHFWLALDEISRILKPNGILILSVPHLSFLHGQPNDYFRFTKFALQKLLNEREMKIIKIISAGGFFSFLLTPVLILTGAFFGLWPIVNWLVLKINKWLSKIAVFLDCHSDRQKIYALNYIVIARKNV